MTPNEEDKIAIQEINQHISDALKQWADIVVTADADGWAYLLNYTDEDIVNALWLINSILQNVAIKSGHIDFGNAIDKGKAFREAIKDYCGVDPAELTNKVLGTNETKAS